MAKRFWTLDRLKVEVRKFETRGEFQKKSKSAYVVAAREGLIEQLFAKHKNKGFSNGRVLDGYYNSKSNVLNAARQCGSRTEFQTRFRGAYDAAKRNGWFELATRHMPKLGNSHVRLVYSIEILATKTVYVGLTGNLTRRLNDHRRESGIHVRRILKDPRHKVVTHCGLINSVNASRLEQRLVSDYKRKGWQVVNKVDAGGLGGRRTQFTFERCLNLARGCKTRAEFRSKHDSAAQAAQRYGWTNKLFSKHPNHGYTNRAWKNSELRRLSSKFGTRGDFQRSHPSAYMTALNRGIMDSLFSRHKNKGFKQRPPGYWSFERCLEAARSSGTKSKLMRDFPGAYDKAHKKGWLEKIFGKYRRKPISKF